MSRSSAFVRTALGALVLAAVARPLTVWANDFTTFGFGARAVAMGGAMAGHVDDYTATYYNPAGVVLRPGREFAIGLQYGDFQTRATNPAPIPEGSVRDSDAFPIDDTLGAYGGMRFLIPFADALHERVGFGVGFYTGFPHLLNAQVPESFVPQYVLLGGQTELVVTQPAVGVKIADGLAVGLGCVFFADVGGNLEIPTGVRGADGVDDAHTTIDQEIQPVVRATAGVIGDGRLIAEDLAAWSVGVTWRDAFSIPLQIPVTVTLGPIPLNIDLASSLLYSPQQVVLGFAHRGEDLTVAVDVSWNQWSGYQPPTLELDLDVTIPIVPIDLKDAFNADPRTKDTVTPRVGIEWRAWHGEKNDFWLRGGYAFEPTPFPEQTALTTYLDGDRHLLSAGVGVTLRELPVFGDLTEDSAVRFDAAIQYDVIAATVHHKERVNPLFVIDGNPLAFPPLTDAAGHPIADPSYPSIRGEADVFVLMFTASTTFGEVGR
ncbi:MAG: outer membrane protein transport protein [bacterium]